MLLANQLLLRLHPPGGFQAVPQEPWCASGTGVSTYTHTLDCSVGFQEYKACPF